MPGVTVPSAAPLASIPRVELMHVGQWDISTGTANFTRDDLAAAVGALDCPAVRRPVLKLGHSEPDPEHGIRWDGEPAVGYVANIATAEGGSTLVGDYVGMPGWLGQIIASAYPDRSIEGCYDFRCQIGHTHPFVLTAVALLGVVPPGIGTLKSLQDVATLYGVAAATDQPDGQPVRFTTHASKGSTMPNPRPTQVAAGVTTDDVRRAYYEDAPWEMWIEEIHLDPLQLIVVDDNTGKHFRVPVDASGEEPVFGDAVEVAVTYVDRPAQTTAATAALVFASRAESRPGAAPRAAGAPQTPPASAEGDTHHQEGAGMDPAKLREALGLPADASDEQVSASLAEHNLITAPDPVVVEPEAVAAAVKAQVSAATAPWREQLEAATRELAELKAARATDTRAAFFDAAVSAGKITPAERPAWEARYDKAPDVITEIISAKARGSAMPVGASLGHAGSGDADPDDALYDELFGAEKTGA